MTPSRIDALIGILVQTDADDFDAEIDKLFRIEKTFFLGKGISHKDAHVLAAAIVSNAIICVRKIDPRRGLSRTSATVEIASYLN